MVMKGMVINGQDLSLAIKFENCIDGGGESLYRNASSHKNKKTDEV